MVHSTLILEGGAQVIRAELRVDFDHFPAIISGLPGAVDGLIQQELEVARDAAKDDAPVRTGRLRDSIIVEKAEEGWALVAGVFYALWVELGSQGRPGRLFLRPNFFAAIDRIGTRLPNVLEVLAR